MPNLFPPTTHPRPHPRFAADTAARGGILSIISVTKPQHGTATFSSTSLIYTPSATFAGLETFRYVVSNGKGGTAVDSVNVTVMGPVCLPLVVR